MNRTIEKLVNGNIKVTLPIRLKFDGHKTVIIQSQNKETLNVDDLSPLQKALIQGYQYRDMLESGIANSVTELAVKQNQERTFLFRALSLVNLAPDIQEAILSNNEPKTITVSKLRKGFPEDWQEQRQLFGMV